MACRQILSPNLDNDPNHPLYIYQGGGILTDWYGWCLAVVAGSFGAKGGSYSAKTAWQSCPTQHRDFDMPEGVWLPVWWEGGQYGHVAIALREGDTITVYSSPYTHKPSFEVFRGKVKDILNYIGSVYGVGGFSGWSETLLESRIIEFYQEKSNEQICAEVWNGEWGTGRERERRLTEAGYDYGTIQRMIDQGIGKPEPAKEPPKYEPVEEPKQDTSEIKPQEAPQGDKGAETMTEPTKIEEPTQNGSNEPTTNQDSSAPTQNTSPDTSSGVSSPDSENKNLEKQQDTKDEFVPAKSQDAQFIGGIIEEASAEFEPSKKVKLIAYLVGDVLLVGSLLIPDIVNTIQAPTPNIWAEYLSKVLLEAGIAVLTVFKLFKRKK